MKYAMTALPSGVVPTRMPRGTEAYLTLQFGPDYMTPPPEEKRGWRHHPLLIDFEHDYEELRQIDPDRLP